MNTLVSAAIATLASCFNRLQLGRAVASVIAAGLILVTMTYNAGFAYASKTSTDDGSLGERFRDRIEQTDRNSERPKTTGEFLDEVSGDVPLGERVKNTIRDSKEAFGQFGKEYAVGAQESARNVKDKAAEAGENFTR
jgi:hypothetical protein